MVGVSARVADRPAARHKHLFQLLSVARVVIFLPCAASLQNEPRVCVRACVYVSMCVFTSWSRLRVLIFSSGGVTDIYFQLQTVCCWVRVSEGRRLCTGRRFERVGDDWVCSMHSSWKAAQMLNEKSSVALITAVHETTVPVPLSKPLYHSVLWCKKETETGSSACSSRIKLRYMWNIKFGYIFQSKAKCNLPEPLWATDSCQRKLFCIFCLTKH